MFGPAPPAQGLFSSTSKLFGNLSLSDSPSAIMDPTIPTQTINLRTTTTKSVTLYPNKAQIVRALNSINLQPGPNVVVITGITPTCDEHSVKVDGTGSATITDLTTGLVDNPEVYLEIYPDEDNDDEYEIPDVSDDESEVEGRLKEVQDRLKELEQGIQSAGEERTAHTTIKQACESYIRGERNYGQIVAEGNQPPPFERILSEYTGQREKAAKAMVEATTRIEEMMKESNKLRKEERRLTLEARRARLKKDREEQKEQVKKERKRREQEKEKQRIHQERVRFWPKKVYKVTISLEAPDGLTPTSSRRSSATSVCSVVKEHKRSETPSGGEATVNLTLTYITTSASWSPRYDLSLSTISSTGLLDFSAELTNTTSEAWKDAKITLSTSSSSYGGLADEIPVLLPWHLRLQPKFSARYDIKDTALRAPYEISASQMNNNPEQAKEKPRHQLFGLDHEHVDLTALRMRDVRRKEAVRAASPFKKQFQQEQLYSPGFGQQPQMMAQMSNPTPMAFAAAAPPPPTGSGLFGAARRVEEVATRGEMMAAPASGGLFAMQAAAAPRSSAPPRRQLASMAARRAPSGPSFQSEGQDESEEEQEEDKVEYSDEEVDNQAQALLVEESVFEESGLTTTYDLPGLKSLVPTSTKSKHKITRIEFRNIAYSHILVPKLRAAAFLKARLKNLSKITLMKGDCGLTLDGTFLGHSSIPRCERGDGFTLNLGIDPSVTVNYAKPTVRRATTGTGFGFGSKVINEIFSRVTTITNTKSNATLDLTLLEQVPVSDDERLKIHITDPRELVVGGAKQWAGAPKEDPDAKDNEEGDWGSATAVAKKGGEITYSVKINPGKGCKISLEYEVVYPGGEAVLSV